jgi:hypothetical protein
MKNELTIKECFENSVCYTHFVILLYGNKYSFNKLLTILGWDVLSPFNRVYKKLSYDKI